MNRDKFVTVVLVILGIMLAIGLFVAGALWKNRVSPKPASRPGIISQLQADTANSQIGLQWRK